MNTQLTPRERAVFDFVYDELAEGCPSPTLAEIAEEFDFHPTNAWRIVFALTIKGYLHRAPRRHRGIEVTEHGHELREHAELDYHHRRAPTFSPSTARVLAQVRSQLSQLRPSERALVLEDLCA